MKEDKRKTKITAVCGVKNSGKTTLIGHLVERMSEMGIRVAVIKHDGHDFECDIPGTDTYSYIKKGACAAACVSDSRLFIHKTAQIPDIDDIIAMFPEADHIILEGFKDSSFPKIEVIREGVSRRPVSNPEGRFLIVSDLPTEEFNEAVLGFCETEKIVRLMLDDPDALIS